jgi:hypothetical protein
LCTLIKLQFFSGSRMAGTVLLGGVATHSDLELRISFKNWMVNPRIVLYSEDDRNICHLFAFCFLMKICIKVTKWKIAPNSLAFSENLNFKQLMFLLKSVRVCTIFIWWKQGTFTKLFQASPSWHQLKSRFFKNRELYWYNLPQNSNLGRESFVQKSGVQIPVGEGQVFCHFSFFLYLFHFVRKKLNIKT